MTTPPSERRIPGWIILAVLVAVVAVVALYILSGPRRMP